MKKNYWRGDNMYKEICSKISPVYHKRVKEILFVLDSKVKYDVKVTKNLAVLKRNVQVLTEDRDGYKELNPLITTLHGSFKRMGNDVRVYGDFVVLLVKSRLLDPNGLSSKFSNTILIYEKGEDLIAKMRGVI